MSTVLGKKQKWQLFAAPAALSAWYFSHRDAEPDAGLEVFRAL